MVRTSRRMGRDPERVEPLQEGGSRPPPAPPRAPQAPEWLGFMQKNTL